MRTSRRGGKSVVRLNCESLEDRTAPAVAYALSGANLLSFDTASPTITQTQTITGVTSGETLVGIDFRPQNGLLYGLGVNASTDTATLYAISTRTGVAVVVGSAPSTITFTTDGTTVVELPDPAAVGYGIDFNPALDRFRVVAGSLNFRVDPNTGSPIDGDNGGGATTGTNPDGPISGGTTTVDAAAYTNNQPQYVVTPITTLYTLDASSNSLFIQNPANGGTQTMGQTVTLGGSTLDFAGINGFDVPAGVNAPSSNSPVTTGSAFAVLNVGGITGLYSINLVDATATFIGNVGNETTAVQGLAVQNELGGFPVVALDAAATNIVRFNTATPGTSVSVALGTLTSGETMVALDFRPQTGQLYGLGVDATNNTATLYLIDPQTGAVTVVGSASQIAFTTDGTTVVDFPAASAGYGLDFNPTVDRIRVVTGTGLNFRVNPNTGAPVDGDNGGGATTGTNPDGTINGSGVTGVTATAYTNSFGQTLTGPATTQYTLDDVTDSLYIQNLPGSGTQTNGIAITSGGNPLNFDAINGFDIPAGVRVATSNTAVTSGSAIAVLDNGGVDTIYRIDLTTGVATSLGAAPTALSALTIADAPAGTVSFTAATFSVSETGPTATITLTRTGSTNGSLTVTVNVTGGTANTGLDFTAGPYTATFADGATSASFTIPIVDDSIFEGNETVVLTIASVDNGGVIGAPSTTTLTINENDAQQTFNVTDAEGYALGSGGTTLIPFSSTNPGAALAPITITGLTSGETLVGIDFRPQNGLLYGLGVNPTANTATLYLISPRTGFATAVGTASSIAFVDGSGNPVDLPDPATVGYDIDFNPAADRVRVVAGSLNFRVNPNNGTPIDGNLGSGTPAGINPDGAISGGTTNVNGTAYVNNFANNGGVTTQFTLDPTSNMLFIQNPPNNGTQTSGLTVTLNGSTLDFTAVKGFDILAGVNAPSSNAAPTTGSGLAILTVGGTDVLYRINLVTGVATVVGTIGATPTTVRSLALQSDLGVQTYVALSADGTQLVRANGLASPFIVPITGVSMGETLVALDFRPQTGQLYALGVNATANTATLYLIDPQLATATAVGTPGQIAFVDGSGNPVDLPATGYGMDFNPTVDRVRVVTSTGLNFRVNPNNGAPVDGNLNNTVTPPAGVNTDAPINGVTGVSATAYTNSFGRDLGTVLTTTQYTLDAAGNTLFIQNPPNAGTQTAGVAVTVGGVPLDFTDVNGFDIPGAQVATSNTVATGFGFAALTVGGVQRIYRINLTTGVAESLGSVPVSLNGFTLASTPAGTINFQSATFTGTETGGTVAVQLTRTGGSTGPLTVTINVTGGSATAGTDFTAGPDTVVFTDGATSATLNIPIVNDTAVESLEAFTLQISSVTAGAIGAQSSATVNITSEDPVQNVGLVLANAQTGAVSVIGSDGALRATFFPFGPNSGGIRVASGDVNGDGFADLIAVPATGAPQVRVFSGATGGLLADFLAYPASFGPASLASGDVNNDGLDDIILGTATNFGAVAVFSGAGNALLNVSAPFGLIPLGVNVAVGDTNGDGFDDIIVGVASGVSAVATISGSNFSVMNTFLAFGSAPVGVNVAAGDINGDGLAEIVVGTSGLIPAVAIYNGQTSALVTVFTPYGSGNFGVNVGFSDVNNDGRQDLITGTTTGAGLVLVFSGLDLSLIGSALPFGNVPGGVYVG